jgi:ABC-2 type transport system permease protein
MGFEYKRHDAPTFISAALFCLKNAISGWTMFVSSTVIDLLQTFFDATIFFFMAVYVAPGVAEQMAPFGGNYAGYVVLGFLAAGLLDSMMKSFYNAVASGYWGAQFEFYDAFPLGIPAYLTGAAGFNLLIALLRFAIIALVGLTLFGVRVEWGNSPAVLTILVVGLISVIGLGLAAASTFFLLNAKRWSDPVSWVAHILSSLIAGVYFPPDILPSWLQRFAALLPHFHLLRALRLAVMAGAGLGHPVVAHDLAVLGVMALVFVPSGAWLFRLGIHRAERLGQFTRWV